MSVMNAGAQNQLAQMQMSAAQRAMQEDKDIKNYLTDPTNDLTTAKGQQGLLRFGTKGQATLKSLADQRKLKAEEDKSNYEFEAKKFDRAIGQILNLTNLPMAFADVDRQVATGSITPQQGAELKTRINNAPDFSTWQNQTLMGMMDAKERLAAMADQQYLASRVQPAPAASVAPAAPMAAPAPDAAAPMAPAAAPAAPPDMANALAMKIQGLEAQRNQLRPFLNSKSAKADFDDLGKQIENLSKGFSISAGGAYYQPGVGMVERPAAAPTSADITTMKALGFPITQDGFKAFTEAKRQEKSKSEFEQLLEDSGMTEAQKKTARAARVKKETTFAPPMQITMPVAIEDPSRPGSVIYVDRSEAVGKTPATAIEGLGPKEIQTREAKYPQAITALKGFYANTNKLERDIDELIANKEGLNEITGYIAGRTDLSAMTNAGRRALAKFNTITAKGGFSELQDMRNASPTGGALGSVSNQEGQQLAAAFGTLSRTQNADDLRSSLTTIKSDLQGSKQRVKEAFDETYAYRANRGGAAPAAAVPSGRGVDTSNPLLGN